MSSARQVDRLVAWGVGLLLLGALVTPAAAQTPVATCGALVADTNSYILTADLTQIGAADCLTLTRNGVTIFLDGHSISGQGADSTDGAGITFSGSLGKNATIRGPGVIHDWNTCIDLSDYALVQDVLAYNCQVGIRLGNFSKCVQCRVHNAVGFEDSGIGITMGEGCLLESSIVETSDRGAEVGHDCKVWDLVLEDINETGLKVGYGSIVARTVISGGHNGPGIDYCDCDDGPRQSACVDSSNSVSNNGSVVPCNIDDGSGNYCAPAATQCGPSRVIPDCATNVNGQVYEGAGIRNECIID
jgi:hypothetical protein